MAQTAISETRQYITFKLGGEFFAIDVAQVREVLEISQITKVPAAPLHLRGVVNVRGQAIPVVDFRMSFGLTAVIPTVHTRIIVMELEIAGEPVVLGGIADSVHEVIELDASAIHPPPRIASRWRADFIRGMGKRGDDFIILIDPAAVFCHDEIASAIESIAVPALA